MDAKQAARFLQTEINRYVKVTGLAPLGVDGIVGRQTATAAKAVLLEIVKLSSPYIEGGAQDWKDFYALAWNRLPNVDPNTPSTVAGDNAYAYADLFQKFANFHGPPILKDTWSTSTTTTTTTPVRTPTAPTTPKPPMVAPTLPTQMPLTPTLPPASTAASISVLGLKMPKWALYVGGGVLALMVVGLVVTRKKPSQPARG